MQKDNFIQKVWRNFLDLIFPISYNHNFLNNLTAEKFLALTVPAQTPPIPNTLAIVSYKNKLVKKAIWSLKFRNNQELAKLFAEILYDNLVEELSSLNLTVNFNDPILITVPLSRQRYRERGYNQVELIAKEIVKIDQNNFFEYKKGLLKKIKNTLPQSHTKNKAHRLKNLKGCFKVVNPMAIKNQNIILLDDVTTTGATLSEAVRTLKSAGPKQIICVTLAH